MKLLVTRHGQTDWNVAGKIQGSTDIELNEIGKKQAKIISEKLENTSIDVILSSPLKRAKQTAQIIRGKRNIPLVIEEKLKERYFGQLEGKTRKDFAFEAMWNYQLNTNEGNVETVHQLYERVELLLEEIKTTYQGKTVLVVTHAGLTVPLRSYLENVPKESENIHKLGIENCEIREYVL